MDVSPPALSSQEIERYARHIVLAKSAALASSGSRRRGC
jgi:hypothetical protein